MQRTCLPVCAVFIKKVHIILSGSFEHLSLVDMLSMQ